MNWKQSLTEWYVGKFNTEVNANTEYHSVINDRDTLVVAGGDSWTFGDSLAHRHNDMYGNVLAQQLDADLLNVGCCGWSNSYVLSHLEYVVELLRNSKYKKIFIVITLTENGRDLSDKLSFPYYANDRLNTLGETDDFYNQVLTDVEQSYIDRIGGLVKNIDDRFTVVVGSNFVWHEQVYNQLRDQVTVLDQNWIECLAEAQGLDKPIRTTLVTGWIFNSISSSIYRATPLENHDRTDLTHRTSFKHWALPFIEKATKVNEWLDTSPMNFKRASKHPNADGHRAWANYILNNLQKV